MRSSDFPATVSPRITRAHGGAAKRPPHVTVVLPVGAMTQGLGPTADASPDQGPNVGHIAAQACGNLVQFMRRVPGANQQEVEAAAAQLRAALMRLVQAGGGAR